MRIADDKYQIEYRTLKGAGTLLKYGIRIPDVMMAGTDAIAPKEYLGLIIASYLKDTECQFIAIADEAAHKLDKASLHEALIKIYRSFANPKQKIDFLAPLFRYAEGSVVEHEYRANINKHNEFQINRELLLSDTREAMILADKVHLLSDYAKMRGMKEDYLRDKYLSDIGLDENGCKQYDLGSETVTVWLQSDLSFVVSVPGKIKASKALPKKGSNPEKYIKANNDFTQLKKDAKKVFKSRIDRLFEDFLTGRSYECNNWKDVFLQNPLLRILGSLLVWSQNDQTFTIKGKETVSRDGTIIELQNDKAICLAHPIEMNENDLAAWQDYFIVNALKQPFDQIWEPVVKPESIKPDRYKGMTIFWRYPQNADKHGIHYYDYDYHKDIGFTLDDCFLENQITNPMRHEMAPDATFTLGMFYYNTFNRKVNHIIYMLDKWTIGDRIRKDDIGIMSIIDHYTAAQVMRFINIAIEAGAINVTAALMEYKNSVFPGYDSFEELTLGF